MFSIFFANDHNGKLKLNYHTHNLGSLSVWDQTDSPTRIYYSYMTLEEIAKTMRITRERVREIETRALNKLRHPENSKILRNFI